MTDLETTVLARELGELGGAGARWVARLLPSVAYEKQFEVPVDWEKARLRIAGMVNALGSSIPELPSQPERGTFSFLMGAGKGRLNPCIVNIRIEPLPPNARVVVRAVAKEGLVKQRTAIGAVERIEAMIKENAA